MTENPLDNDPDREARIRARAYRMWEEEGRPHGRDHDFWERAEELDAIETNPPAGLPNPEVEPPRPRVEEAALQANLGEFPSLTDQGDRLPAPVVETQAPDSSPPNAPAPGSLDQRTPMSAVPAARTADESKPDRSRPAASPKTQRRSNRKGASK